MLLSIAHYVAYWSSVEHSRNKWKTIEHKQDMVIYMVMYGHNLH